MEKADDNLLRAVFNGSIDKLKRMNEIIVHASSYSVNENIRGLKHNLRELLRESHGVLNSKVRRAFKDRWWKKGGLEEISISFGKHGAIIFDPDDLLRLNRFFFDLTSALDKDNVTWSRKEMKDGFSRLRDFYGVGK